MVADIRPTPRLLMIEGDCDCLRVISLADELRQEVEGATADQPLRLELSETKPTALALQLLVSAGKSLDRRGALAGFGPNAQAAISYEG